MFTVAPLNYQTYSNLSEAVDLHASGAGGIKLVGAAACEFGYSETGIPALCVCLAVENCVV